jgi:hypothetical protein
LHNFAGKEYFLYCTCTLTFYLPGLVFVPCDIGGSVIDISKGSPVDDTCVLISSEISDVVMLAIEKFCSLEGPDNIVIPIFVNKISL